MFIDQRYHQNGYLEGGRGEARDGVEGLGGRRI
jgi:hypothetical protein